MRKKLATMGLTLQGISMMLMVLSWGNYPYAGEGLGRSFRFWIFSLLLTIPCLAVYLVEAIWDIIQRCRMFCFVKLLTVILAAFLFYNVGTDAGIVNCIIWSGAFLLLFGLEMRSLQ